jgi:hypothetical protein
MDTKGRQKILFLVLQWALVLNPQTMCSGKFIASDLLEYFLISKSIIFISDCLSPLSMLCFFILFSCLFFLFSGVGVREL